MSDIEYASQSANDKMMQWSKTLDGKTTEIHTLSDRSTLKLEQVQKLLEDQFQDLNSGVDQAIVKLNDAGIRLDRHSDKAIGQADIVVGRFEKAGEAIKSKIEELNHAGTSIEAISQHTVSKLTKDIESIESTGADTFLNLEKISDTLSIKSKEINALMLSALGQAKTYTSDMRQQVQSVSEQSHRTSMQIGKSVTALIATMDDVAAKTQQSVGQIEGSNKSLYDESARLSVSLNKSVQDAQNATRIFSDQTDILLKTSKSTLEKMNDIQAEQMRQGQENFLTSARYVLESLHSLSIDFIRTIDGKISEKEWKAYQKGDIAIFTTKLAESIDKMPSDKIRNKYMDDNDFRSYVQKFISQIEDVLDKTDSVDKGAVLGTTFAASDVGKIYRFLCNIAGRTDKKAA